MQSGAALRRSPLTSYDAVVVGTGPNGLTAAAMVARTGRRVLVVEAADRIGGSTRTDELTLPGFQSDVCSAVHPLAFASPAFIELELTSHGLEFVHPELPLAHPLDGGRAALLHDTLDATADGLGEDADAWRALFGPHVEAWEHLRTQVLGPVRFPRQPVALARFGLQGSQPRGGSWRHASPARRPERCSPARPATRSSRSTEPSPRRSGSCSTPRGRPAAGRSSAAAPSRSPTHSPASCVGIGVRPPRAGGSGWPPCH